MIRLATKEDAPQIAAIYRPFCEDNCVSFETEAPGADEVASRIEKIRKRYPWLVDERDGRIAGYAYASPHRERAAYRWAVEVTVYIHDEYRRKGVGQALYLELFKRLKEQGLYKAYAGVLVPNPASQAFHESMGFKLVGIYEKIGYKLGAWLDVGWWVLSLQPESGPPSEPTPPSADPKP
ncbi:MAG TPA: arsinothricin resistance N-acetyltransferase ArsN1 family B [Opitutaceae bacterium]